MPIDFPENPSLTPSYTYTYKGISQSWEWGFKGGSGISAWIATGYEVTGGGAGSQGFQGFQGVTGPTGVQGFQGFQGPTGTPGGEGREGRQGFQGAKASNGETGGTGPQGFQGFQGNTGSTGVQGFQGFQGVTGIVGIITAGGVGMSNPPLLSFTSPDGTVTITGITSASGITISLTAGGGGGANPQGSDSSIQFKSGSSLSGISEAKIVTVSNINNKSGYSGNFVYYTESTSGNNSTIESGTTISVPFGTRNVYVVDNISLAANQVLTFGGFTGTITGSSMTLVLGYTGATSSTIVFPGNQGILWAEGPFGVTVGSDAKLYPRTTPKKFDILYFFADGTRVFGNAQRDFRSSR